MEKLYYYVVIYFYQYEPYTTFQALYAHKEDLDFDQIWKEIRDKLEKRYPYSTYDDKNEDYNEFIEKKAKEALNSRGFIELEADVTTIGPDDKYDTFEVWKEK